MMFMQARLFSTAAFHKAVLKPLPYALNGLEPVISENLMSFHYSKHHQTYVNNLNMLTEKAATALANGDHKTHVELSQGIKFNGGGHLNHEFFWESLSSVDESRKRKRRCICYIGI